MDLVAECAAMTTAVGVGVDADADADADVGAGGDVDALKAEEHLAQRRPIGEGEVPDLYLLPCVHRRAAKTFFKYPRLYGVLGESMWAESSLAIIRRAGVG